MINVEKFYRNGEVTTMLTVNFGVAPDGNPENEQEDRVFDRLPEEVQMIEMVATERPRG